MVQEKRGVPWLSYHQKEDTGIHAGKRGQFMTLICVCTYTQMCRHMHMHSLPCLASALVGWVSWRNIPSREQALGRSDMTFLHSTDCMQHSFKKIYYLFARLKRHKDNIHVCDPDCLWSGGREIVQSVLPSSTPGMPAREQSCCPRGEGQILQPSANTVSSPSGDYWGGEWHTQGTWLAQPHICVADVQSKNSSALNPGKSIFFFREHYPQITCLSISSLSFLTSKFLHHHPLSASTKTFISVFSIVVTCPCGLKIF